MSEPTALSAAMGALKTAYEGVKKLVALGLDAKHAAMLMDVREQIFSAQDSALAAQKEQFALLDEIQQLKKKAAELEDWAAEKDRYSLQDFGRETFARVLKPDMANGEPAYRICAHCYDNGKKSRLQHRHHNRGQEIMSCNECGNIALGCPGELPREANRGPRHRRLYG